MKVKLLFIFALLLTAVTGAWADFTPREGDVWDEATKTLTVNSNPADGSYYGNGEIQHLVIASGVTSIGDGAFSGCTSLTTVSIPDDLTSVGFHAFNRTPWLEGQPDGVVYVGKVAYRLIEKNVPITSIVITDGTVSISPSAFEGCTSLATVIIPASVTSIGDYAFNGCPNLTSVIVFATTPPALGFNVFAGDRKIYVPNGTERDYKAAAGWNNYTDYITVIPIEESGGACGTGVTWKLTAIPNNYILTISGTGDMGDMDSNPLWENYKSDITTVVIGDGVTSIGECAFYGCTSLATVSIPASVTSIGESAFDGCTRLATVSIPASVTSVGSDAFENTPWLGDQPDGVVYVGKVAYKWKGDATIATIADGTISISPRAFSSAQITSVSIPASVTSIGVGAFQSCQDLTSVIIPASVTSIGNFAFQSCTNLESVYVLPTTPPTIGSDPFNACNALTAIVVPAAAYETYYYDNVKGWNSYQSKLKETSGNCGTTDHESDVVWRYDNGILTISGTGQMMYYGSALGGDNKYHSTAPWSYLDSEIQKVIVEDGVTYIGSYAFAYCTALTSVSLPASVTALGDYVCYSSNVTRIDIPSATTVATIGTEGFNACPDGLQIAVPAHLLKNYKEAANWSAYAAKMVGVLDDDHDFNTGDDTPTGSYEYSRTFKEGVAATLCLPFEVNYDQISPYGQVYTFAGVDKSGETWVVVMQETNKASGALTAYKPYLFLPYIFNDKGTALPITLYGNVESLSIAGTDNWEEDNSIGSFWSFQGVTYYYTWNESHANLGKIYGFAAQSYDGSSYNVSPGDFVKAAAGASIAPFRAFLQFTAGGSSAPRRGAAENLPSRMTVRLVNADGETTTLSEELRVKSEGFATATAWFTLDGRKLDKHPTQKGIYINGNKKIVIK